MKLRQHFYELIEPTYFSAKSLLKEISKKNNSWAAYQSRKGFKIICDNLQRIWQYDSENEFYIKTIEICANLTNILIQRLPECAFKEHLHVFYLMLLDLLPEGHSFQLSLFAMNEEFGFTPIRAFYPLEFVVEFLRGSWVSTRDWWHFHTSFKSYQGKQLTLEY